MYQLPGTPPPLRPQLVNASDGIFTDHIAVSWSQGAGASGYEVWRAVTNSTVFASRIASLSNATNYDDYGAASAVTNYYWIKSTNTSGSSSYSAYNSGIYTSSAAASLNISPTSTNVSSAAWSGRSIAVTANVSWTATTNAAWLAITSSSSGSSNGTVTFGVATNAGTSARTGGVVVAGGGIARTCTVVQAGSEAPPQVHADEYFGVISNRFGFNVNWTSGRIVVVDGCTNLTNPAWVPLQTNTLTTGFTYFSDPKWTNIIGRFYRIRSQP